MMPHFSVNRHVNRYRRACHNSDLKRNYYSPQFRHASGSPVAKPAKTCRLAAVPIQFLPLSGITAKPGKASRWSGEPDARTRLL